MLHQKQKINIIGPFNRGLTRKNNCFEVVYSRSMFKENFQVNNII
jgi:hypothetical protein